jgi:carbon-monoxide dehydrogenase small subunit
MSDDRVCISFRLNGRPVTAQVPVHMKTLAMLRETFDLTGTKYACGEGECGACTVMVDGRTVNSCLMHAVDCDGREVVTVEGLQDRTALHPVQEAFVAHGAIQCGFCMPGMIVQAAYLVARDPGMDARAIRRGLEGNVCRCTGYAKVVDAVAACCAGATGRQP